jgi:hypothetical protein
MQEKRVIFFGRTGEVPRLQVEKVIVLGMHA